MKKIKDLKWWRSKMGWTQAELAEQTGLTRERLSDLETRKRYPQPATAEKLAEVFGTTVEELLDPPTEGIEERLNKIEERLSKVEDALEK